MKNILWGLAIVIIIIGFAIYLYPKAQSTPVLIQAPQSTPSTTPATSIYVPIDQTGFTERISFPVINTSTKDSISIRGTGDEAQNPSYYIYVNKKQVGEIGGYQSMASFSPNTQYFAVRDAFDEGCAGLCSGYQIAIINIASETMRTIYPKPNDAYIESYSWDGDSALDFTSYSTSYSSSTGTLQYYRTSLKQIWRYDLITGSTTLISSTP